MNSPFISISFREDQGKDISLVSGKVTVPHYYNPTTLPNRDPKYNLTLSWDLDETLVTVKDFDTMELSVRPFASYILNKLRTDNPDVEFIVWTAGTKAHAKRVLERIGFEFDYIITRHPSWFRLNDQVKKLSLLDQTNRPLNSLIMIDDRMDICHLNPCNTLIVPAYDHTVKNDKTLLYVANILHLAINKFRQGNFKSIGECLFSPLVTKCIWKGHYFYGVKGFCENKGGFLL